MRSTSLASVVTFCVFPYTAATKVRSFACRVALRKAGYKRKREGVAVGVAVYSVFFRFSGVGASWRFSGERQR